MCEYGRRSSFCETKEDRPQSHPGQPPHSGANEPEYRSPITRLFNRETWILPIPSLPGGYKQF